MHWTSNGINSRTILLGNIVYSLIEALSIDLDAKGKICAMTMEHARGRADVPHFTFEEIAA